MKKLLPISAAFAIGVFAPIFSVLAADVEYVGSSSSGDVALPANWGGTLPTTADTATFPVGFLCPSAGLTLGQALTLGSINWNETVERELDLGGRTLTLDDASGMTQMSLGQNAVLTIKNGTLDVASTVHRLLPSGDYGTFILTNATMKVKKADWRFNGSYGRGFTTKILKHARLIFSEIPNADVALGMYGKYDCSIIIDGGFVSMMSSSGNSRRLMFNQEWENGILKVVNGGVIDFPSPSGNTSGVRFTGNPSRVLIDGGAMYQTNGITWYTDNYGIRYSNYSKNTPGTFAVTNSTVKGTRFNHWGSGGHVTFHNSNVDFYFNNHNYAGYFFGSASGPNSATISGTTTFKAKAVGWNSTSRGGDIFTVAGGTFDAPVTMAGTNGVFAMTGGEGTGAITMNGASNTVAFTGGKWTGTITMDGASNAVTITGGNLNHSSALQVLGTSNVFTIADTAVVTGTYTTVSGAGARLVQNGGTAYGGIQLTGNGVTAHLKNGATRWSQHKSNGLQFKHGVRNAVLVIEDATYENNGNFCGDYKGSGYVYTDAGCIYTNCPGSAIEFRGTHPKLINSEATLYAGGGVYVAMTLGSFTPGTASTGPNLGTEPLDNPLALRYILPANGYAEAPLQGACSRDTGRPIALCGNARIEVDASGYSRPKTKTRIPLVTDVANFTVYGNLMLDIDALNRNNAANLPEDSKLEYVAADKTLYLTFKSRMGMVVVFQ